MTILAYPIASIIARKSGDILHPGNDLMRGRLDLFECRAEVAMCKAAVIVHAPTPVSA